MEVEKENKKKVKTMRDKQMGVTQFSSVTSNKLNKRGFGVIYPPSKLSCQANNVLLFLNSLTENFLFLF